MDEKEPTLFSRGNIKVTSNRLIIGKRTYYMDSITSVSIREVMAKEERIINVRQQYVGALVMFAAIVLFMIGNVFGENSGSLDDLGVASIFTNGLTFASVGVGMIGLLLLLTAAKTVKLPEYHLVIRSAAGEEDALRAEKEEMLLEVVASINKAKLEYRKGQ